MTIKKADYLSTKDTHALVMSWKNNPNKKTLEEILMRFDGYIEKYSRMLKANGYVDRELTSFLYLFGRDLENTKALLKQILFSYSYPTVKAELILIFINVMKHYKYMENGPMFPGYLKNYYKFKIKNWIDKLSKNPLNKFFSWSLLEDSGKENYDKQKNPDIESIPIENKSEVLDIMHQDEFVKIRKILTYQEQIITQYYFIEKMPCIKLLHLYSLTRKDFNSLIKSIKNKLATYYHLKES